MRAKGLEPVRADVPKPAVAASRRGLWAGALAAVVLLAVAGWYLLPRDSVDESGSSAQGTLSLDELKQQLTEQQVAASGLERLLIADDAVAKFAKQSAGGKTEPVAAADALYAAIRKHASSLAFVPWSLGELRGTPIMTAAQTLATLKDGARAELYPLEVAALAVAALRSLDVPAQVAELVDVKGRRSPLDPSGYLGYFVVAVPTPNAAPRLYDVYGGQKLDGASHVLQSDLNALGAALATRALYENMYLADPKLALESSSHALRLAPSLPSVRTVRGVVVLTEKMVEQGLQEFQAARELRGDAPRLQNLAGVMLVTGDVDKAQAVLAGALEKAPDYASARATLGMLLMMSNDPDAGLLELQKAERLAPNLTLVQWAMAEYAMRKGDSEEALQRARRAYALRPSFDAKLRLAALLRQASKHEEMRKLVAEMLAAAPAYRRDEVRALLGSLLGSGALASDQPARTDLATDDLSGLGGTELKLDQPGTSDLSQGQNAPKLRLQEPGGRLKLRLGGE